MYNHHFFSTLPTIFSRTLRMYALHVEASLTRTCVDSPRLSLFTFIVGNYITAVSTAFSFPLAPFNSSLLPPLPPFRYIIHERREHQVREVLFFFFFFFFSS